MADITLTAAVRDSLLSLQNTTKLVERTQGRLSTGLKVAGPVDDPVAYFQAKGLSDRAYDFTEKKSSIDQGVSTVTAALDGVNAIEKLVRQMKGIVNSMKSATVSQMSDLISQFNDLRTQINNLASDSTYQGTNLINGTGTTLSVEFSNDTASRLSVSSVDITVASQGLNVTEQKGWSTQAIDANTYTAAGTANVLSNVSAGTFGEGITAGGAITITWQGPTTTYSSASGNLSFSYGTASLTVSVMGDQVLSQGATVTINVATTTTGAGFTTVANNAMNFAVTDGGGVANNGNTGAGMSGGDIVTFTYNGPTYTFTTANAGSDHSISVSGIASAAISLGVGSGQSVTLSAGQTFTVAVATANFTAVDVASADFIFLAADVGYNLATAATTTAVTTNNMGVALGSVTGSTEVFDYVKAGDSDTLNAILTELDNALSTLRTEAQKLGSNVALLQTRLDFTESYVNTLTAGASKLTLADINEEGANLLALQTRQQLGIQALSFAGQAEQSVLSLFR